jgi:hypothetical protein
MGKREENFNSSRVSKGLGYYLLVARARIELPTPCFSDKGKPFALVLV